MNHELFMRRCIELAAKGSGFVAPNPMVGAVLVGNGNIISEGYHKFFGGPHAEVNALDIVTDRQLLSNITLYVNLEPCSHFGKTPPCANLIISKGISKVVIANTDPNPKVNGNGVKILRDSGVEVITGVLEKEGLELNKRFFTFHTVKRPYIILKWAQSADGYIAPLPANNLEHKITWISGASSRLLVHKWRSEEHSILIGSNTAKYDNPKLNVRGFEAQNPIRIIFDPNLELPPTLNIFDHKVKTILFNNKKSGTQKNLEFVKINKNQNSISDVLTLLYERSILSVLVEGGAYTLNKFIKSGMWDEARVFTGATPLQSGIKSPDFVAQAEATYKIEMDHLNIYRNFSNNFN
ncbi:MAG: bifunctional diaminohydroxyphosphoribosylaminopyrimidine deaminase/5-amino-6-(5-phosphoribosylamino)uracil reductase RibD [Bacteroidetes bacterium]|nr:bifunctional diaminohydroxyphosphoribosylaminopyrimidine deaminase/5-amino-6-(5-phosphoribosylamino)uracil reductase RibD [Bacteroidota bacterium]